MKVKVTETTSGNSFTEHFTTARAAREYAAFVNGNGEPTPGGAVLLAEVMEDVA